MKHRVQENQMVEYPRSFATWSLDSFPLGTSAIGCSFPFNVVFQCEDIVAQGHKGIAYDTVLCCSVTKWIHLFHGDEGIKALFRLVHAALLPGGKFILEPQPWKSYHKRKYTNSVTCKNYTSIQLRPKHFEHYLLHEVGFRSCDFVRPVTTQTKRFKRPMYIYTK